MNRNSMILDEGMPVALGNCIRVENVEKSLGLERNPEEGDEFVCIQVESEGGKDEYPILLTPKEMEKLPRARGAIADEMVAGRAYQRFVGGTNYYCVRLKTKDGDSFVGVFDIGFWKCCFARAVEHPRSCTRKGVIRDMFD